MARAFALLMVVLACGCPAEGQEADEGGAAKAAPAPAPEDAAAPHDAGVAATDATDMGATARVDPQPRPEYDLSEFHLDDTAGAHDEYRKPPRRQPARPVRAIQITLRSTPPGAIAAVDGEVVGRTPAFWEGEVNGVAREFTFVLPGYAMARYRFVPVTSGVVHGRLEQVPAQAADAGPGGGL